ncbi:hypothetical protein QZH41_001154 [Actinostola sp. cb2023]|nr:hypothetical protein QZH41_001154 [Actinostola sp. cb2023]
MDKIKEKLTAMKDAIEQAEDRESDAQYNLRAVEERAAKAEENAESYKRRIALLTAELGKTEEKLEDNRDSLANLGNKIEQEQATERELGGLEIDTDEQLNETEMNVKEALARKDEKLRDLNDVSRKLTKTEYDVSRASERCDAAEAKIKESENELKSAGESMIKLEQKDEQASERETELDEKVSFLKGELKPKIECCEDAEQRARKLERYLDELTTDIDHFREKKSEVDKESGEILQLADDEM